MIALITIVVLLACLILAFFVLIQNPKGGGLTGTFGSISSQVMGVKQSTDVMEKGTWFSMGIVGILCIVLVMFYPKPEGMQNGKQSKQRTTQQQKAPASKK